MMGKRYKNDGNSILELNNLQNEIRQQIGTKLSEGIYQFEFVSCPICNSDEFETLSQKDRYGFDARVVICRQCGLIRMNPRLNQESYNSFYKNEYRKLYLGKKIPSQDFFLEQHARGMRIYSYLESIHILQKPLSELCVFEVGCGAGGILQYFREKGCRGRGVDIDEEYVNYGRTKYGLDLSVGTIADVSFDEFPDVIIYSHVLEHLLFPKEELTHIYRALSPNGIVYIETPGIKNLSKSYDMDFLQFIHIAHTYCFTLTTLRNLLETNGFKLISGDETIRSVFKKCEPIFRGITINDREAVTAYLNRLEKLRRWVHFSSNIIKSLLPPQAVRMLKSFRLHPYIKDRYR